jgi:hypothetical protein
MSMTDNASNTHNKPAIAIDWYVGPKRQAAATASAVAAISTTGYLAEIAPPQCLHFPR